MKKSLVVTLTTLACIAGGVGHLHPCFAKKPAHGAPDFQQSGDSQYTGLDAAVEEAERFKKAGGADDSASAATVTPQPVTPQPDGKTERVSNLANLEALLNIMCNLGEIVGFIVGVPMIVAGTAGAIIGGKQRWIGFIIIGVGLFCTIGALSLPAIINWLVSCARDAGAFN